MLNTVVQLTLISNPVPSGSNFTWTFNGQSLNDTLGNVLLAVDSIRFARVMRDYEGNYQVTSSNIAGSGEFSFQLSVNCK